MNKILVASATMAGSTAEIAQVVGEELTRCGFQVDILSLSEVKTITGYTAVVVVVRYMSRGKK
jgi:menaquinone-dependent protoporphyrinogen IX oxidase